jgi:hypothetical protein
LTFLVEPLLLSLCPVFKYQSYPSEFFTPRVVRGNGKGTQCLGVYLGHPVPGGNKYGELALQVGGVSRIGTIKYGLESRGTALVRTSSNSKLQTRPLVREGATK